MVTMKQGLAILVTTVSASSNLSGLSCWWDVVSQKSSWCEGRYMCRYWIRLELLCMGAAAGLGKFPGVVCGKPETPGF